MTASLRRIPRCGEADEERSRRNKRSADCRFASSFCRVLRLRKNFVDSLLCFGLGKSRALRNELRQVGSVFRR
jgi:hypothetical protein